MNETNAAQASDSKRRDGELEDGSETEASRPSRPHLAFIEVELKSS